MMVHAGVPNAGEWESDISQELTDQSACLNQRSPYQSEREILSETKQNQQERGS